MNRDDPLGFEEMIKNISDLGSSILGQNRPKSTYPPYDVIQIDENKFMIEMAVAGFKKEEIIITVLKNNVLSIVGKIGTENKSSSNVHLHKGIANRSFSKKFSLEKGVEVSDVTLSDGILKILFDKKIPEEEKSKVIPIN